MPSNFFWFETHLSLYCLSILNAVNSNADLVVTAVTESIVKSPDTLRLVRHAGATLRIGNTIGLVRVIAQIEIGRPDIAIYHAPHVSNHSLRVDCHSKQSGASS